MVSKLYTLLLLLVAQHTFGQVRVETFLVPRDSSEMRPGSAPKNFPLIKTGNDSIDNLITQDIRARLTWKDPKGLTGDTLITPWSGEALDHMDFEVTYVWNNYVSLLLAGKHCLEDCTNWMRYLNYNTATGMPVTLGELVDTTGAFRAMVYEEMARQYEEHLRGLKAWHSEHMSPMNEQDFNKGLELCKACNDSVFPLDFSLLKDHMVIKEKCELPSAVKELTPHLSLWFYYSDIEDYLRVKLERE